MLSGGGTGGSVTPLLAVAAEMIKEESVSLVFVGSQRGPERELVAAFNDSLPSGHAPLSFVTLEAGKWRRYFSWRNFFDLFKTARAFFRSFSIIRRHQPDLIISAGSFLSVPLVWAAAGKKIPIIIHQQDLRPGLANRLMAPFARVITVAFERSLGDYGPRAVLIGNPIRPLSEYMNRARETRESHGFSPDRPLVLVLGGATGAAALNELIAQAAPLILSESQIFHLTGRGKAVNLGNQPGYITKEFVPNEEVIGLMAAADLIITRAGLGALTEISALAKPAVIIPIPDSHQEDNAALFSAAQAALVLSQKELSGDRLAKEILGLLGNEASRQNLGSRMQKVMRPGAAATLASIALEIVGAAAKK